MLREEIQIVLTDLTSKIDKNARFVQRLMQNEKKVMITFKEIEEKIGNFIRNTATRETTERKERVT